VCACVSVWSSDEELGQGVCARVCVHVRVCAYRALMWSLGKGCVCAFVHVCVCVQSFDMELGQGVCVCLCKILFVYVCECAGL